MSEEPKIPVVAIVGRQNVGKSSLMNALARRRLSIVTPIPGVTRDRVSAYISLHGCACELVDTGGIGMDGEDQLRKDVERQISHALSRAHLVLLVVDAKAGVMPLDAEIARRLREGGLPTILVVNKADTPRMEPGGADFSRLGFAASATVSAAHRRNLDYLAELMAERLPEGTAPPDKGLKIAVVGRRNVGKSTYVNALCGEERVIVSEIPGTTRDAVDVRITRGDKSFVLIDTAGLRKPQRIASPMDLFSRDRTEKAMRRADVTLLLFDATEKVTGVDRRLGNFIEDEKIPCVVVLNKWDLVPEEHEPAEFFQYLTKTMPGLSYAPVSIISAKAGDRIWDPIEIGAELHAQAGIRVSTPMINQALQHAQNMRAPGSRGGKVPRIYYGTQTGVRPPSFVVFVNERRAFARDYVRYLENRFREFLPFREVPIRLEMRSKESGGGKGRGRR